MDYKKVAKAVSIEMKRINAQYPQEFEEVCECTPPPGDESCSCTILGCLNVVMSENPDGTWTGVCKDDEDSLIGVLSTEYDADIVSSSMALSNVVLSSNKSALKFAVENTPVTAQNIGDAFANYWESQIEQGEPAVGDSIISVVNDAAKIGPIITSGLIALSLSKTGQPDSNEYEDMVQIIENAAKTIIWTVMEKMPDGSVVPSTNTVV